MNFLSQATSSDNQSDVADGVNYSMDAPRTLVGKQSPLSLEILHVLEAYITPTMCAIGCLGNALILAVLCRNRFRKTDGSSESGAHLGLGCLAASNFLFCAVLFPRTLLLSTESLFRQRNFQLYYQMYGTGLVTTFSLTSTCITVIMAFLRYLSVCHPFLTRRYDTFTCAKLVYPIATALCVLFNIPSFFQYTILEMDLEGERVYLLDIGRLDSSETSGQVFQWCRAILALFLPALILAVCNFCLIRALRNSHRMRMRLHVSDPSSVQRSRKWITVTLIAIAVCFILFVFPAELMDFFIDQLRADVFRIETFLVVRAFANVIQVANFALNFILYCVINVHFRATLWEMCQCRYKLFNKRVNSRKNYTDKKLCSSTCIKMTPNSTISEIHE